MSKKRNFRQFLACSPASYICHEFSVVSVQTVCLLGCPAVFLRPTSRPAANVPEEKFSSKQQHHHHHHPMISHFQHSSASVMSRSRRRLSFIKPVGRFSEKRAARRRHDAHRAVRRALEPFSAVSPPCVGTVGQINAALSVSQTQFSGSACELV